MTQKIGDTRLITNSGGDWKGYLTGSALGVIMLLIWVLGFVAVGADAQQGNVYRILYLHVPAAFSAFFAAFLLCIFSVLSLRQKAHLAFSARAAAEVGLLFTVITLATGSIWGKPTWGTWWTWDGRLTTTLILALLLCGYLLLWNAMERGPARIKACAILGILIFADVPIIYKSVTWWRTLHQPPSLMRAEGASMSPEILRVLVSGIVVMVGVTLWLIRQRSGNLKLSESLDALTTRTMLGRKS